MWSLTHVIVLFQRIVDLLKEIVALCSPLLYGSVEKPRNNLGVLEIVGSIT
jgi:hypothetical protein